MKKQVRITVDAAKWDAVEAIAKARRMTVSQYVEHVLTFIVTPEELVANAARIADNVAATAADTNDRIKVISDFVVDLYREEAA